MPHDIPTRKLCDLPLWRLIVALEDAERTVGPGSSTARAIAKAIQERLRQRRNRTKTRGPTHAT
jgi:hypothetical protein